MNPNRSIDTRTAPSDQAPSDSGEHQSAAETLTGSINATSTPFTEPAMPLWMVLLHSWTRHRIVLVLCSSGLLVVPVAAKYFPDPATLLQSPSQQQVVSQTDYGYQLLELGMTLTDAQATLGRAIEVSRNETTATYKWVNSDGSAIMAVFKGDRLVSKEQLELKQ